MNTLDQIVRTLGPPQVLRTIGNDFRVQAAVARWRHKGAFVNLSDADTYQLVFNVSGGQIVEVHSRENIVRHSIRAGSIAIVCPNTAESVTIIGQADTLQFFLTKELIESVTGGLKPAAPPQLAKCQPQLQAAAAQALVALDRNRGQNATTLDSIVASIACQLAQSDVPSAHSSQGGLSPGARRRVSALLDDQMSDAPHSRLSLGKLAATAGLSIHHFIKAFRQSEGETPYARAIARRIDNALTLLLRADTRVDRVADETGFSSPSHFVSAFRRHMGVTPGALRDAAQSRL